MDSYQKIIEAPRQFAWTPELEHIAEKQHSSEDVVPSDMKIALCGMGGSALAGDIIKTWLKLNNLTIHRDFHLPHPLPNFVIAISYSGNTEETLSVAKEAREKHIPLACIASGGALEEMCHAQKIPFIKLPSGYQPREAIGFMLRALVQFLAPGRAKELALLAKINGKANKTRGEKLAKAFFGKIPLIYTSHECAALGYNWKIKINETAKNPSFTAIIPELFHNEMTGFDMGRKSKKLAKSFVFIVLEDPDDAPEIKQRISVFKKFMHSKEFTVIHEKLSGASFIERFMRSVNLADWTSYALADLAGADPENVPWVEQFKALNREKRK